MTTHRDDAAGTGPSSESLQGRIQILNRADFESDPTQYFAVEPITPPRR